MDKRLKQALIVVITGIGLYAALMNLGVVWQGVKSVFSMFLPLLAGLITAFILCVPRKSFEKLISKIFSKTKRKPQGKVLRLISLLLTFLSVVLVVVLVCTMAIPEIITSVSSIIKIIQEEWPEWVKLLNEYNIDTKHITSLISQIDFNKLTSSLTGSASVVLGSVVDVSVSIISGITTVAIALVISIYVLLDRVNLAVQSKKILYAFLKESVADRILYVSRMIQDTFSKFLSGQCVEAVILGTLIFIAFSIFGLPYAGLVAVLTGVCAFVPYVGAFVSCALGTFLILISDPEKALICLIVYLVVQFIENQFIYPHVVGNSVGLSALWPLLAALIGGELFGLLGMIFFIPITAVIYNLVKEAVNKKIEKRKLKEQ